MKEKTAVIITTIVMTILFFSIVMKNPFNRAENPHGVINTQSFKIVVLEGQVTRYHLILTLTNGTFITNGDIIIATAENGTAKYTVYTYSNNTPAVTTLTAAMNTPPSDFVITYSDHYLTYNNLKYYTQLGPPITFASSTTVTLGDKIIIEISQAVISWGKTTTSA